MPPKSFQPPRPTSRIKSGITKSKPATTTSKPEGKRPLANPASGRGRPKKKNPSAAAPESSSSSSEDSEEEEEEAEENSDSSQSPDPSSHSSSLSENSSERTSTPRPRPRTHRPPTTTTNDPNPNLSASKEAEKEEEEEQSPAIPAKLLTTILHTHFQHQHTRINREARDLLGVYIETFVREAVARAVVERRAGGSGKGADWLEVEDLEKLAPQLILDF